MYLKKIEIIGFKSFAEKTVLTFHEGITAIVGPNGCGKSNISDAFRWVLGEQSAKSMRGSKMYDVIFAGTAKRKALNFAEVTITLADVEGSLPTEYNEVSVTRRIHRSGESDYLINRRPVRLKDVYDLFLDSGIGKNAFSIFEQGKLEQVINFSPLERRYIFEEAAGILRFLQRKREALRRLQQTEQNIERVRDIHQEVERQIIVLEEQAEKAKVYKENRAKLETLEIGLFVAKWDNLQKRHEKIRQLEEEKQQQVELINRGLEKKDIERQNANIQLVQVQKELQAKREKVFQTRSKKEIKTKEWQTSEDQIKERVAKEYQWRQELEEMIEKRKIRQLEIEQAVVKQQEVEKELTGLEGVRKEQKDKVHAIELEVTTLRDHQHTSQQEFLKFLQEENRIESELKQITLRLEHNQDRKTRIIEQQEGLQKRLDDLKEEIESKTQQIGQATQSIAQQKETDSSLEQQIEGETRKIKETQDKLDAIYQEKAECKARQNVLLRLRDEMEGFSTGTKKLLQEAADSDSTLHHKVKGLYETFAPESGAEMALSVVMKPYTQTLVVQTQQDFRFVVDFAKEHNIRDFSLVCLENLRRREGESITSKATSLLSKIKENLLADHFLQNIFLTKNKEEALGLNAQSPGIETWADEGVFIDRHGVVFFTSEGENNVFLREAELKTLHATLKENEHLQEQQDKRLKAFMQNRARVFSQKKELDQVIRKAEMKLVEEKYALQRLNTDLDKVEKEIGREQNEVTTLNQASASLKQTMASLNQKHGEAKAKAEEIQKSVDTLNKLLEEKIEALKAERGDMQEKDAAYQKIAEEKRKIVHQLNVFEVKDLESLQQEKRLEEEIQSIQEQRSQLKLSRVGYEQQLEEVERALTEVTEACRELENTVTERRKEIDTIEDALSEQRDEIKKRETELHEFGIQAAQMDSSCQALQTELHDRLHLTVDEARAHKIILEKSMEKTEREMRALRRNVESAGDINMTSIEEFDKYKERYQFLNQQIDDLTIAKEKLVEIITELDTESRKVFKETFGKIQENFRKNFQILFKGGEADLRFTESSDILEAGIEIVAKPPGKQMRSISLLSGGEKCLTAVALLFAIFEVKPAPFCILDEIDAPLDDTNVERFLNVVKQFTDKCQFIIITHNKRTMAIADVLFGVSMQEKGVSNILSLEFSHDSNPKPALV